MEDGMDASQCFACGPSNPRGLHLDFRKDELGKWCAAWIPEAEFEGFRGIVHGGIVSTVLDESMAKAVTGAGVQAFTVELRVRFRRQVQPGTALQIHGWVVEHDRRMYKTEAALATQDGAELAHAWATFLVQR